MSNPGRKLGAQNAGWAMAVGEVGKRWMPRGPAVSKCDSDTVVGRAVGIEDRADTAAADTAAVGAVHARQPHIADDLGKLSTVAGSFQRARAKRRLEEGRSGLKLHSSKVAPLPAFQSSL